MKRNLLMLLAAILAFASCKKDEEPEKIYPTASFSYTLSQNQAPATVYLNNTSTDADEFYWSVSDGRSSTAVSPEFNFNEPGTYEITLTATNRDGADSYSRQVIIQPKPVSAVKIDAVSFTNFPLSGWDTFSGPDVYFKIWTGNVLIVDGKNSRVDDVTSQTIGYCAWLFQPAIYLLADQQITVELYDYDDIDSDDLIASTSFNFANYTSLPPMVTKVVDGTNFNLSVTWIE